MWYTGGADVGRPRLWRAAVVKLSDRVEVEWIETKPIAEARPREFAVSRSGTLAAARVTPAGGEPVVVVSMYAPWTRPHASTGSSWIVSDVSAHRVVSDLSALIGHQHGHRVLAAGDLNILHGHGEDGSAYWAGRYQTVFARMEALGLPFMGPQAPNGARQTPGQASYPATATMSPPTTPTNKSPPQQPANSTSSSPPGRSPQP